mgnify:CR=1 FL=1
MFRFKLLSTDIFPPLGGATGALTSKGIVGQVFPEWEVIIYTIILAAVGAVVGYLVKLFLDWFIKKCK